MNARLTAAMAGLFVVGSVLFGLGSFPPYFNRVDPIAAASTFFAGSLFFTSAAYLQYYVAINAERDRRRWFTAGGMSSAGTAAAVQLVGTLFFNISTFSALASNLSVRQENHLVWAPDMFGSAAFLVSSVIAIQAVRGVGARRRGPYRTDWLVAADNLAGSVAFGISALAAFVLPTTGEVVNIQMVNLATFVGAALFMAASILVLSERP